MKRKDLKWLFVGILLGCSVLLIAAGWESVYTLLSTFSSGDYLLIQDVSDTTDGSAGTTKYIEIESMNGLLPILTAEPDSIVGHYYIADNDTWDPCSYAGTNDYMVLCTSTGTPGTFKIIRDMVTGQTFVDEVDVSGGLLTYDQVVIEPQSKTYDDNDDDDETIQTDLTSSMILVTGDNDGDNDSIDLQDGTTAGELITFLMVALVDADDTFTIDAETDSTCTGCPDSGIFTYDDPGDKLTLLWSGSAWFYMGSYEVD